MYNVGKIVNTQGLKGEVRIYSQTDFPEVRFSKGSKLILLDPEQQTQMTVVVETGRLQKNVYIVKFAGWNDINYAEKYKGWLLKISADDLVDLDEETYYHHEILGCRVVTEDGVELGKVTEILKPGANDVWVVTRSVGKPILLPVIDDVLLHVDRKAKIVTIALMEGLID